MTGTPDINTQISSLGGLGTNVNIPYPAEFFCDYRKMTAVKKPTHSIHSAFKSGKMTISYQKTLLLLHPLREIKLEQYQKENARGSCPKLTTIFLLTSNTSHHNILQKSVLSVTLNIDSATFAIPLYAGNLPSLFFSVFTRRDCQTFIHVTMQ